MRKFISLLLITIIPIHLLYSYQTPLSYTGESKSYIGPHLTYDDIIELLDKLESGELDRDCNLAELERIYALFVFLAKQGALPEEAEEIEKDFAELFNELPYQFSSYQDDYGGYILVPALLDQDAQREILLCKNKWKKKFKKHKKMIIIGAIVVVTTAVFVGVAIAASGTASAAATKVCAALAGAAGDGEEILAPDEIDLKQLIEEKTSKLKEQITQEEFLDENDPFPEETGRILGSLFAHQQLDFSTIDFDTIDNWDTLAFEKFSHSFADKKFSTDYASLYETDTQTDYITFVHWQQAKLALDYGCFEQAVEGFTEALKSDTPDPEIYLDRGIANLGLQNYEEGIEDLEQYTEEKKKTRTKELMNFSVGFASELPKGIRDSASDLLILLQDVTCHPIHTAEQMYGAVSMLAQMAKSQEWMEIASALAPEVVELVDNWEQFSSNEKGRKTGYIFGRYGADFLLPGGISKGATAGVKGVKKLKSAYKMAQKAERVFVLEATAAKTAQKTARAAKEAKHLKKAGKAKAAIAKSLEKEKILLDACSTSREINFTKHGLQRALERGITKEAILDAIENPLIIKEIKVDRFGRPSQRFIGKEAEIVVNPNTREIISVNPTSTKKARKLIKRKKHAKN